MLAHLHAEAAARHGVTCPDAGIVVQVAKPRRHDHAARLLPPQQQHRHARVPMVPRAQLPLERRHVVSGVGFPLAPIHAPSDSPLKPFPLSRKAVVRLRAAPYVNLTACRSLPSSRTSVYIPLL
jgi:hypothetical protein